MSNNDLWTKEDWPKDEEVGRHHEDMLQAYSLCLQHLLPHLERISKIESFEQMKEELTKLIAEREEYRKFVYDHTSPFRLV